MNTSQREIAGIFRWAMCAALLCLLATAAPSFADITISPASPRAGDQLHLRIADGQIGYPTVQIRTPTGGIYNDYDPRNIKISMANNKVTVLVPLLDNGFGNPSNALDIVVGAFPPGTYDIEVDRQLADGTGAGAVGTAHFVVAPRPANEVQSDMTDMWWDPEESGWGISLIRHPSSVIFATWFVYGPDGKPIWYVIPEGAWSPQGDYQGPVYRTTGPYFGAAPFEPTSVHATLAGQARLAFSQNDSNRAEIFVTADGVSFSKFVQRQGF